MSAARRYVASVLARSDRSATADVVAVLVSELVTNAVVHASPIGPGEVVVGVAQAGGVVRVEVTDGHPGLPVLCTAAVDGEFGRGMVLVDALATAWGVLPNRSGKVVWFEVKL